MKNITIKVCPLILSLMMPVYGWVDYGVSLPKQQVSWGKPFRDFAISINMGKSDFEQDTVAMIKVRMINKNLRTSLHKVAKARKNSVYLLLGDSNGTTLFSQELSTNYFAKLLEDELKANGETIFMVPFQKLSFTKPAGMKLGRPSFTEKAKHQTATLLTPQVYTLKLVIIAGEASKRPDLLLSSNSWKILIRAKSAKRMSDNEKSAKLKKYLKTLDEGAYGGVKVASQLSALGEIAIDALIKRAETTGDNKVFETRIWSLVCLCNSGSKRAEEYIMKRLRTPQSLSDLNFLAWHSQALPSKQKVNKLLEELLSKVISKKPLPWHKDQQKISDATKYGFVEFTLKHFSRTTTTISDENILQMANWDDQKFLGLALLSFKPKKDDTLLKIAKMFFEEKKASSNLKICLLKSLYEQYKEKGFPKVSTKMDVKKCWKESKAWLVENKHL